jgi:hypothetical protein
MANRKTAKAHIRQARPAASLGGYPQIKEDEARWEQAIRKDPDLTYCALKGEAVFNSLEDARKVYAEADICDHCRQQGPYSGSTP